MQNDFIHLVQQPCAPDLKFLVEQCCELHQGKKMRFANTCTTTSQCWPPNQASADEYLIEKSYE